MPRWLLTTGVLALGALGSAGAWWVHTHAEAGLVGRFQVFTVGGDWAPKAVMVDTTNGETWAFCGVGQKDWGWCYLPNASEQSREVSRTVHSWALVPATPPRRTDDQLDRDIDELIDAGSPHRR